MSRAHLSLVRHVSEKGILPPGGASDFTLANLEGSGPPHVAQLQPNCGCAGRTMVSLAHRYKRHFRAFRGVPQNRKIRVPSAGLRSRKICLNTARPRKRAWACQLAKPPSKSLAILWVFAIVTRRELARYTLVSPDLLARPSRVGSKLLISFSKVFIDGLLSLF